MMAKRRKPIERVADPHRLARVYMSDRQATWLRYWRERWWRWIHGRYEAVDEREIDARILQVIKHEFDEHSRSDGEAARCVTTNLINNVKAVVRADRIIPTKMEQPCWIDGHEGANSKDVVAMKDNIYDLNLLAAGESGTVWKPSPTWFSQVLLPYKFDALAKCEHWDEFLEQVFEGDQQRIDLVHEIFGYCLTSDTGLQRFFMLVGDGANGKSVLLEVLTALLGEENVSNVPLEMFHQRFQLTPTLGKLANIATEIGEIDRGAEGILKAFTSGDQMYFDRKNIPGVEARPTARLLFSTNNPPRFRDRSSGIWRRMIIIPFDVQIPRERQDPKLAEKLRFELPGIFNRAIQGLRRLRKQGCFTEPKICREALEEYQLELNSARAFLKEMVRRDSTSRVSVDDLYSQYIAWCAEHDADYVTRRQFGKDVRRAFPGLKIVRPGMEGYRPRYYEGLAYTSNASTTSNEIHSTQHSGEPGVENEVIGRTGRADVVKIGMS